MAQRVLVLSSEDLAEANEVPPSVRPFVDEAEEIYVVAPTLTTWMQWLCDDRDSARASADERLRTLFDHMRASGLKPHGEVGAENQVTAIADALAQFDADLIVIRLHAPGSEHENWRERGIAEKVRSRRGANQHRSVRRGRQPSAGTKRTSSRIEPPIRL